MSDKEGFGPEDLARYVRWGIIAFFVYAIAVNLPQHLSGKPEEPAKPVPVTTTAAIPEQPANDPNCKGSAFDNFSLLTMPLFPVSSPSVSVSDLKQGTGAKLACGQKVTLRYTYATRGGNVIFSNMDKGEPSKGVRVGSGEMLPGFERGIIGMKAGGERDISIASELGFGANINIETLRDAKDFKFAGTIGVLTARATLLSIDTPIPASEMNLRVIDQRVSDGRPYDCGDTARVMLAIWSLDGKLIYSREGDNPLRVTLGRGQLPYGVEQGIIGLMPGGRRTVIIPPAYLAQLDSTVESLLKDANLPKDQVVLAAIEGLPEKVQLPAAAAPVAPAKEPEKKAPEQAVEKQAEKPVEKPAGKPVKKPAAKVEEPAVTTDEEETTPATQETDKE